jgi:hypothetical protein
VPQKFVEGLALLLGHGDCLAFPGLQVELRYRSPLARYIIRVLRFRSISPTAWYTAAAD